MKKNFMILLASCVVFSPLMAIDTNNSPSDESVHPTDESLIARGGRGGGGGGRVGAGGGRVGVNRGIDRTPGIGRPSTVAGAAMTGRAIANRNDAYSSTYYYPSTPYYTCDPRSAYCPY
jgi:hypothetical protein